MREIVYKAKTRSGKWVNGLLANKDEKWYISNKAGMPFAYDVRPETICQFTGLCDKNGKKICENDILMCHGNSEDLVKTVFGEFGVRNIETGSIVDKVVGWHYEIIPTDAISRCEPFCYSMPLTKYYIDRCEMEVIGNIFDNKELLQEEHK